MCWDLCGAPSRYRWSRRRSRWPRRRHRLRRLANDRSRPGRMSFWGDGADAKDAARIVDADEIVVGEWISKRSPWLAKPAIRPINSARRRRRRPGDTEPVGLRIRHPHSRGLSDLRAPILEQDGHMGRIGRRRDPSPRRALGNADPAGQDRRPRETVPMRIEGAA